MSENKRIAKNSFILYFRLVITTIIGLYTSRLVLKELGAEDFGLYVIVGGIVSMMNFLNTTMVSTTNRYIAVEIGKGSKGDQNKVFNTSLVIHIVLALILILLVETFGVFYVRNHLNVIIEKIPDGLYVLHMSAFATAFSFISIPFQGLITANEKFLVRAIIEIIKAILKLILVLLLTLYIGNKLRAYAIIMLFTMALPAILFMAYCFKSYFQIIRWKFHLNFSEYWEMLKYSGWVMLGVFASMGRNQGAALILNAFFGTVLNAAYGIAFQVFGYINMFVRNLNQAAAPQILKSHSAGDEKRSLTLVYSISKFSFFLMLIPSIPLLLSIENILKLWLGEVPEFTKHFTVLMVINGLVACISGGFDSVFHATGKIKAFHIYYSVSILSILPLAYFAYKFFNLPPYTITVFLIASTFVNLFVQIRLLLSLSEFNLSYYLRNTILPAIKVLFIILPQLFLKQIFNDNLYNVFIFTLISLILTLTAIYFGGLKNNEKDLLKKATIKVTRKIKKKNLYASKI